MHEQTLFTILLPVALMRARTLADITLNEKIPVLLAIALIMLLSLVV